MVSFFSKYFSRATSEFYGRGTLVIKRVCLNIAEELRVMERLRSSLTEKSQDKITLAWFYNYAQHVITDTPLFLLTCPYRLRQ